MKNKFIIIRIVIIILILVAILLFATIYKGNEYIFTQWSDFAGLVGLAFLFWQIMDIKDDSQKLKNQIFFFNTSSRIPKALGLIHSIQANLSNDEYKLAQYQITDLLTELVNIIENDTIKKISSTHSKLKEIKPKIKTLKNKLNQQDSKVTTQDSTNLNNLHDLLTEIEAKINNTGGEHNEIQRS